MFERLTSTCRGLLLHTGITDAVILYLQFPVCIPSTPQHDIAHRQGYIMLCRRRRRGVTHPRADSDLDEEQKELHTGLIIRARVASMPQPGVGRV